MSSLKPVTRTVFHDAPWPAGEATRHLVAWCLIGASAALSRVAGQLLRPAAPSAGQALDLEFHAEAGAAEGALYVDGELVGWISGVTRL